MLVQPRLNISELEKTPIRRLILNTLSQGVNPQVFERLNDPSTIVETNLTLVGAEKGPQNEGTSFVIVYVFAIALMIGLFTTNGYLMQSVIDEKETRLIEILISTVRPAQLLAGKILALGLIGLLQIVVWIGSVFLLVKLAGGSGARPDDQRAGDDCQHPDSGGDFADAAALLRAGVLPVRGVIQHRRRALEFAA